MTRPGASLAKSKAFRDAALRSEAYRAWIVIGIAIVLALVVLPGDLHPNTRSAVGVGLSLVLTTQGMALLMVGWARRRERLVPTWLTLCTLILESLIPGGIMFSQLVGGTIRDFGALNMPPVVVFGMIITLSTLRLRPAFCIITACICFGSYAGIVAYIILGLGVTVPSTGLPLLAYTNSAAVVFINGVAAAWVARELRRHVEAAMSEADTRLAMARIEGDLEAARSIQRALLPRESPKVPRFDIAGWNRSADQTGGDYYDWQRLPDGLWMVTLADVSGHGIGPALVTAACRAYVRASSFYNADLASLTERMNKLLAADLPEGRFVTMVSVLIDPRDGGSGPVRMLSAGHGPIVLYAGATGMVEEILPRDVPLAVVPDSRFGPAMTVEMKAGDVLALVTDGFVEWARRGEGGEGEKGRRGEQFGMERLRESLKKNAGLGSREIIAAVAKDVETFARGEPQQDDLTIVVIKKA